MEGSYQELGYIKTVILILKNQGTVFYIVSSQGKSYQCSIPNIPASKKVQKTPLICI